VKRYFIFAVVLLSVVVLSSVPAFAQAVITSGDVSLGVGLTGELGAGSLPSGSNDAGAMYGIYYAPTMQDAIAPGCFCEGWGVSINNTTSGYSANANGSSGTINSVSFTSTASTATAVTTLGSTGLQISQAYAPSAASNVLFEDTVTLTNTSGTAMTNVEYARAMDWDIPPTEFDEYVTIGGVGASDLVFSNDNGFCAPNPLGSCSEIVSGTTNVNFTTAGPTDQGSYFVFDFGTLAAGDSTTFDIFYGAGADNATVWSALGTVGAEVYALGYNSSTGAPGFNDPTWAFGFSGVGGTPVTPGVTPEPTTFMLLGTGLATLIGRKLRRSA
jgi:hypothetical protein